MDDLRKFTSVEELIVCQMIKLEVLIAAFTVSSVWLVQNAADEWNHFASFDVSSQSHAIEITEKPSQYWVQQDKKRQEMQALHELTDQEVTTLINPPHDNLFFVFYLCKVMLLVLLDI